MDSESKSPTYWHQWQTHPELWTSRAQELAYAANVLYERASAATEIVVKKNPPNGVPETQRLLSEMGMNSVAMMLAGFAMENMLKALRIAQLNSKSPVRGNDPRVMKLLETHNLGQLAKDAGIETNSIASEALETLRQFLEWTGRYSRPVNSKKFWPDNPAAKVPMVPSQTWFTFLGLFEEASNRVKALSDGGHPA